MLLPFISLCREEGILSEDSHSRHEGRWGADADPPWSGEPFPRAFPAAPCSCYSAAWRLPLPFPTPLHCWVPAGAMETAWCTSTPTPRGAASTSKSTLMATSTALLTKPSTVSAFLQTSMGAGEGQGEFFISSPPIEYPLFSLGRQAEEHSHGMENTHHHNSPFV